VEILLNEKVLAAILGLAGGTVATFLAPWIQWGIERRRIRMAVRREKVERWRAAVNRIAKEDEWTEPGERMYVFINDSEFLSLMPSLSQHAVDQVGSEDVLDHDLIQTLFAEIDRIERNWGLS